MFLWSVALKARKAAKWLRTFFTGRTIFFKKQLSLCLFVMLLGNCGCLLNTNKYTGVCFRCSLRFPSTNIRLYFQSLVDDPDFVRGEMHSPSSHRMMDMKPLNISIPQPGGGGSGGSSVPSRLGPNYHHSPPNSPTGTISVPNSCPTSPSRHGHHQPGYGPLRHGTIHVGAHHQRAAHATLTGMPQPPKVQSSPGFGQSNSVATALDLLDQDNKPDIDQLNNSNNQNTINIYPADEGQDLSPMPSSAATASQQTHVRGCFFLILS